jgi:hypothetical protein
VFDSLDGVFELHADNSQSTSSSPTVIPPSPLPAAPYHAHFSHQAPFIDMHQISHQTGLAYLTPCHLPLHPEYGSWFALRAVVSFNCPASDYPGAVLTEIALDNPCSPEEERDMIARMNRAELAGAESESWRHYLECRDGLPQGQEGGQWRYPEAQICYHYTKNTTAI